MRHPRPAQACSGPFRDCVSRVRGPSSQRERWGKDEGTEAGENWHVPELQDLEGLGHQT